MFLWLCVVVILPCRRWFALFRSSLLPCRPGERQGGARRQAGGVPLLLQAGRWVGPGGWVPGAAACEPGRSAGRRGVQARGACIGCRTERLQPLGWSQRRAGWLAGCSLYRGRQLSAAPALPRADYLRQASVVVMESGWERHLGGMLGYVSSTSCRRSVIARWVGGRLGAESA